MKPAPPVTKILISLSSIAPDLSFASPCWWALFDARLRPGNLFYSCLSDLLIAIKHQDLSRSARPPPWLRLLVPVELAMVNVWENLSTPQLCRSVFTYRLSRRPVSESASHPISVKLCRRMRGNFIGEFV